MLILCIYPEITINCGAVKIIIEKTSNLAFLGYDVALVIELPMGRELSFPLDRKMKHVDMGIGFNCLYSQRGFHRLLA